MVQLRDPWVTEPDEFGRGFLPVYDTREAEGQWLLAIGEIPPMPSGIHLELTALERASKKERSIYDSYLRLI